MFFRKPDESIRSRMTLDEIDGLQIRIPASRHWFSSAFLGLWLFFWAFGVVMALGAVVAGFFGFAMNRGAPLGGPDGGATATLLFMLVWLAGWTAGGAFVLDGFLWQVRGKELIRIDPQGETMTVQRLGTFFPRRTRVYPLAEVRNLRFGPLPLFIFTTNFNDAIASQLQSLGNVGGNIAFDHDGRTHRFGSQLSETESRRLIQTIKDHYKIEDDRDIPLPVERL